MTRIRIVLLAVAIGVAVPSGLLAWRALQGQALERAVRHQAVAERAFDEMERSLSNWLEVEEDRPFDHYGFYVDGAGQRSPLASTPMPDFVVGAFQVDPDGSLHTPLAPRDEAAAKRRGDWPGDEAVTGTIERVNEVVDLAWPPEERVRTADAEDEPARVGGKVPPADSKDARRLQDPGTTLAIGGLLSAKKELSKRDLADEAPRAASAYEVLQGLNRGADRRAERKQKVIALEKRRPAAAKSSLPSFADAAEAEPGSSIGERFGATSSALAPSEVTEWDEREVAKLDELQSLRALGYAQDDDAIARPDALPAGPILAEEPRPAPRPAESAASEGRMALDAGRRTPPRQRTAVRGNVAPETVGMAFDPMVGLAVGDAHLLLYRTVLVGEQGYRQGWVLDRARLGAWLVGEALPPEGLGRLATVSFDPTVDPAPSPDHFVFRHRFAEPFDELSSQLTLSSLAGVSSPGAIYGLVGLLLVVGTAGLWAVHRMVGVTVHFAERRSNFVSAVTHELKTPLTAIRMYGEMLRDGLVPSEAKKDEYYGTITDESERLSRLIDNVLEFSRLERGTREMSFAVGSLEPVVREGAEKLRTHAQREGFSLELEIEPDLPTIRYDRDALLQVLFNLVDNAMKYAASAESRRIVLCACRRGAGVELSVRDFGPGVSGRHLSRIFEPFYRGEDENVRNTKGTGIGLALVRDLASRMGAGVRGANAQGGGFRVSLEFEAAEA